MQLTPSDILWINVANAFLGIATLVCVLAVAWGVAVEVMARARKRLAAPTPETHVFALPELGLTMADGGKPEDDKQPEKK